jgi:hypothetical protein
VPFGTDLGGLDLEDLDLDGATVVMGDDGEMYVILDSDAEDSDDDDDDDVGLSVDELDFLAWAATPGNMKSRWAREGAGRSPRPCAGLA